MTDKELIKQEIERLIAIEEETSHLDKLSFNSGRWKALTQVKVFIDSLPEEPASEDLEEAATKWDETASFQPFYMQLDCKGNPCEVKQDIITHKESFKAGAEWQKRQDEELFSKDTWTYIEENYPNITKEEKLRLYDVSIKSRLAGANVIKQQLKEVLQTEYEKGRFDAREEMTKNAVKGEVRKGYVGNQIVISSKDGSSNYVAFDASYANDFCIGDNIKIIIIKEEQE